MIWQKIISFVLLTVAVCAGPIAASAAVCYTITDLGTLGDGYSDAYGINNAGIVVGTSATGSETHAFFWKAGRMHDLGTLGGHYSVAHAVNDDGEVVGYSDLDPTALNAFRRHHAFLYSHGKMRDLGTLPGDIWSEANAINAQGKIVGTAGTGLSDSMGVLVQQAVIWSQGRIRPLGNPPSEAYGINRYGLVSNPSKIS